MSKRLLILSENHFVIVYAVIITTLYVIFSKPLIEFIHGAMNSITKLNSDAVQDISILKSNDNCQYTPITVQIPLIIKKIDAYLIKSFFPKADKRTWLFRYGKKHHLGVLHAPCTKRT